jgi:hypothetical protein
MPNAKQSHLSFASTIALSFIKHRHIPSGPAAVALSNGVPVVILHIDRWTLLRQLLHEPFVSRPSRKIHKESGRSHLWHRSRCLCRVTVFVFPVYNCSILRWPPTRLRMCIHSDSVELHRGQRLFRLCSSPDRKLLSATVLPNFGGSIRLKRMRFLIIGAESLSETTESDTAIQFNALEACGVAFSEVSGRSRVRCRQMGCNRPDGSGNELSCNTHPLERVQCRGTSLMLPRSRCFLLYYSSHRQK